ncbi:hypothetical protein GQ43DRAFT_358339, partial [Delitschia confertaspora ATCC 74209]
YETVSYIWREPVFSSTIFISGLERRVTSNLHFAFPQFRNTDSTHDLWVNVVCINHIDDQERRLRTEMMGEILFYADKVLVWL